MRLSSVSVRPCLKGCTAPPSSQGSAAGTNTARPCLFRWRPPLAASCSSNPPLAYFPPGADAEEGEI